MPLWKLGFAQWLLTLRGDLLVQRYIWLSDVSTVGDIFENCLPKWNFLLSLELFSQLFLHLVECQYSKHMIKSKYFFITIVRTSIYHEHAKYVEETNGPAEIAGCFSINFTFWLYFNRNLSWGLISKIINVSVVMIYERAAGAASCGKVLVVRFSQWNRKQRLVLASERGSYDGALYREIEWDKIGAGISGTWTCDKLHRRAYIDTRECYWNCAMLFRGARASSC